MYAFTDLGARIAREWVRHRFASEALPEIAINELTRARVTDSFDYRSILNWISSADTLPFQMNVEATFGEPPVTLFWHPSFYIEALFWASSTTAIHGHGFVGAFQVLAGTSLQSLFEFHEGAPTHSACRIGELRQTEATLLRPGSIQPIHAGERFVHSVFHLGYPSVTLVVRTHGRGNFGQYSYRRPGIALPYRYEAAFDQLSNRLLQVARLQAMLGLDDLRLTAETISRQCDLSACFKLLETIQPILYKQQRIEVALEVIGILARTIGLTRVSALAAALTLEQRLTRLQHAREHVVEDDLRLFLALLLTQQERSFVFPIVAEYIGIPDPADAIAGWILELGRRRILQVPTGDSTRRAIAAWLSHGQEGGLRDSGANGTSDGMTIIKQLQAESLLAPLLRETTAVA